MSMTNNRRSATPRPTRRLSDPRHGHQYRAKPSSVKPATKRGTDQTSRDDA